ncbi:DUF2730 family protein [Agrobacterium vitis]|nr:DUF2730 family protein [Allorhizobium ampelinum]
MIMDMTAIGVLISLALNSINLLTQFRTMMATGEKKLEERMVKVESKLVEYDRRIQSLESELKHLPDRGTTHRLELSMAEIAGRLNTIEVAQAGRFSAMEQKLAPIQAMGERLNEVLLEQAKNEQHRG